MARHHCEAQFARSVLHGADEEQLEMERVEIQQPSAILNQNGAEHV